jgi:hypothetical protein
LFHGINIIQLFFPFGTNIIRNKYTFTIAYIWIYILYIFYIADVVEWSTAPGAAVYQWCEFKSRRGKNKNLTAQRSNSNIVWFNFQTYIYILYFTFLFSLFVFVSAAGQYIAWGQRPHAIEHLVIPRTSGQIVWSVVSTPIK